MIEQSYGPPKVTKDGVTVAKSIEFKDKIKNVGASLVKQVANATNDVAGDGKFPLDDGFSSFFLFFFSQFSWVSYNDCSNGVVNVSGTTCATVLTRAIFSEGCKSVAAGVNAMDLRRGISMAVDSVVTNLKSRARMISTSDEITQVGFWFRSTIIFFYAWSC